MIQKKRQHSVTKKQIETLSKALEAALQDKADLDPRLYEPMIAGTRFQIDDLLKELRDYENLEKASALHMRFSTSIAAQTNDETEV
jgi:hypothetical protein